MLAQKKSHDEGRVQLLIAASYFQYMYQLVKMLWLLFAESLSSAWRFFMGHPAALDKSAMKKRQAEAVCGNNGNGSEQQGQ
jgi:hypothetical protein